jgi:hypothetical protein
MTMHPMSSQSLHDAEPLKPLLKSAMVISSPNIKTKSRVADRFCEAARVRGRIDTNHNGPFRGVAVAERPAE